MKEATLITQLTSEDTYLAASLERIRPFYPFLDDFSSQLEQLDKYETTVTTVEKYLKPGGTLLDFGSGSGLTAAILADRGIVAAGADDLNDPWHLEDGNRAKIEKLYQDANVELIRTNSSPDLSQVLADGRQFDMIMCHDVLEHLHDSPKELLDSMVSFLKPGGYLYLSVPNAANLRKRIDVLRGKTNHPPFAQYYEWEGPWRGHVREYVLGDLVAVADYLGLHTEEIRGCDHMTFRVPAKALSTYMAVSKLVPGLKDTVMLVARKP